MSLQDKWNEYKEDRERKKYFRSRNDLYLDSSAWIKTILAGLAVALIVGAIVYYVSSLLNITSSIFYIVLGAAVGTTVKEVSGVQSQQVGILAVVLTIVGSLFSIVFMVLIIGIGTFNFLGMVSLVLFALQTTISDLFLLICIVFGACVAYQIAS